MKLQHLFEAAKKEKASEYSGPLNSGPIEPPTWKRGPKRKLRV